MTVWTWPGSTVVRVVDGDSLVVRLTRDLGFNGTAVFEQHVRLNRINCPPIKTTEGLAAAARVTQLCYGATVLVETVGPYKYGDSWMAEITLATQTNLSDLLVSGGLAVYWDGHGPRPGG